MAAAVVLGVFIILTDSQVSGILSRYYSDFSWLFLLAAAIAVFSEYASIKRNNCSENTFIKILVTCFIISIIFYGFNIFNDVGPSVIESNPEFYYKAKYLIGFLV